MEALKVMTMCMPIHDRTHCFRIPELVDNSYFTKPHIGPGPSNYPELELAGTILSLVEFINPQIKDKDFTKALTDISEKYIQKVREGLPKGVELSRRANVLQKAA